MDQDEAPETPGENQDEDAETPETPETPGANQDDPSETVDVTFNCSIIEDMWERDPDAIRGTKFFDVHELCTEGQIDDEEVNAYLQSVDAPNLSYEDQITRIANEICERVTQGTTKEDADVSEIEAACTAQPRDNDDVINAAIKHQQAQYPNEEVDEEAKALLEETCTSIAANRDKIDAALFVLAERSAARRLQDDETAPVTSYEVATDMLSMYDCFCDQSNPDNLGCLQKALKVSELVATALDEQAAIDLDPDSILDDLQETVELVKKQTSHLRHSEHDGDDMKMSVERALSEAEAFGCDPKGISRTTTGGYKLCLL